MPAINFTEIATTFAQNITSDDITRFLNLLVRLLYLI
jgi:hypothetical protein